MIEALKSWVSNIIAIIFFITLVEIIIPEGRLKKYIGLITGVLVIVSIITPVVKVVGRDVQFDMPALSSIESLSNSNIEVQGENLSKLQTKQIMEVYKAKLEKSLKQQLIDLKDAKCKDVICRLYENDNNKTGDIKELEVILMKNPQKQQEKGIKPVDINININKASNSKESSEVPYAIKKEIVRKINEVYKIDSKNIKINYLKER